MHFIHCHAAHALDWEDKEAGHLWHVCPCQETVLTYVQESHALACDLKGVNNNKSLLRHWQASHSFGLHAVLIDI